MAWMIPFGAVWVLVFGATGALSLLLGILVAQIGANRDPIRWTGWAHRLLQLSIIGLGAGIDLPTVARAGIDGMGVTLVSITVIVLGGIGLAKLFKVPGETGVLISVGTAICGGSAIAAVSGVLRPRSHHTATAIGVVFLLNAVALFLFPFVGHLFGLTQVQFGWWAALAIHDTSSVVGAGLAYGPEALVLATTVKLARSLWIVPVVFAIAYVRNRRKKTGAEAEDGDSNRKAAMPWFILGFLAMATIAWLGPQGEAVEQMIFHGSQRTLSVALFLIGTGLSPQILKKVGWRPVAQGVALWIPTALISMGAILFWG